MKNIFLEKAEGLKPVINEKVVYPIQFGRVEPEEGSWFGYKFVQAEGLEICKALESVCVDFGEHCTGRLSFTLQAAVPDAPKRVHIKFAETLQELGASFDEYKGGLSRTWLQEETVTLDEPGIISLPRRYAFRYIKVTVLNSNEPVILSDFKVCAGTSADYTHLKPGPAEERLKQLDEIGIKTLAECMQSVYEDGPKRDRRLWIGDLRIQALVNYETFDQIDLVKRCLYLFAGYTKSGNYTPRCVFVDSRGTYCGGDIFVDYSLMFNLILCDYFTHTGDTELVDELFDVADEQMLLACDKLDDDGIVQVVPVDGRWAFIDWCKELQKITSMQGVILYTLRHMAELSAMTGRKEKEAEYRSKMMQMQEACRKYLYDAEKEAFINHYDSFQYSVHSQVWMVLAGVLTKEENQKLLRKVLKDTAIIKPVTPYMHHYVVEALLEADMPDEAFAYMTDYWGRMADLGADTYWEVFVPDHPEISPYSDRIMNSACHAWSCSPSYFIRKYDMKKILQTGGFKYDKN